MRENFNVLMASSGPSKGSKSIPENEKSKVKLP